MLILLVCSNTFEEFVLLKHFFESERNEHFTRVTRLGEFSPIGLFFALGSFMSIKEVAQ
jgi:hypothetical protein